MCLPALLMSHIATSKFEQWRSAHRAAHAAECLYNNKTVRSVTFAEPPPTERELQEMLELRKLALERLTDYIEQARAEAEALRPHP